MQTRSGSTSISSNGGNFKECNSDYSFNPTFPDEKNCVRDTYDKYNDSVSNTICCKYFSTILKFTLIVSFLSILHWTLVTLYISWCYKRDYLVQLQIYLQLVHLFVLHLIVYNH